MFWFRLKTDALEGKINVRFEAALTGVVPSSQLPPVFIELVNAPPVQVSVTAAACCEASTPRTITVADHSREICRKFIGRDLQSEFAKGYSIPCGIIRCAD